MNRQIRSFKHAVFGLFPLLLVSAPALAATDLTGPSIPPPSVTPPPPALSVQYPFASVNATEVATSTTRMGDGRRAHHPHGAVDKGVLQYNLQFRLNRNSDGLAPASEDTLLSAAPDPGNPQAGQIPSFQVFMPAGCFVNPRSRGVTFMVRGLGCGVEVRLHDPVTLSDTSLNGYVRHFTVRLSLHANGTRGNLHVRIKFAGFNVRDNANPKGVLSVILGNDGVLQLPMQGRVMTRGSM